MTNRDQQGETEFITSAGIRVRVKPEAVVSGLCSERIFVVVRLCQQRAEQQLQISAILVSSSTSAPNPGQNRTTTETGTETGSTEDGQVDIRETTDREASWETADG
ncbi:Hypothetical predicted protein [Xyrichtys novacula]|uniref:Uncharacterized protein n=1 Tax=Xyrichtys novacula TaxID=13765 RepID=A0AAV1H8F9_XYRNO|nr:Hypothetical predicted protein [Xyrichtys novacula]